MSAPPGLHVVVLAAGHGKRMRSRRPKVLQPVGGRAMLAHVLDTAAVLDPERVHVVIGHGAEDVRAAFPDRNVAWVEQPERLGTGHAVAQALPDIPDDRPVLVLYGDVPLVSADTLESVAQTAATGLSLLSAEVVDPGGYGRILRDADAGVTGIVEEADADREQRAIREINSGIMAAPSGRLKAWLVRVDNDNRQGEHYLTDCVALAVADGVPVQACLARDADEILGANDRWQLACLEHAFRRRAVRRLCAAGATVVDPERVDIRGAVSVGADVVIDAGAVLEGDNTLGDDVYIGPYCVLRDCALGAGTRLEPHSVLEGVRTAEHCRIGPFARLRPGTVLDGEARVGNFVETKAAHIGAGSKVNHLSYVGDAELGRGVNIGAGTITCNYDGANKHRTVIGDEAFIGSDTQLVAPVEVGRGATIGAGSTITRDAPADTLTVSRAKQTSIPGWQRPRKKRSD